MDSSASNRLRLREPSAQIVPRQRAAALKKQITLLAADLDRVPVALATSFHSSCLSDINDCVNFIHVAINLTFLQYIIDIEDIPYKLVFSTDFF